MASWNSFPLEVTYEVLGWFAFVSWSISFYPQVILNFRRKRVIFEAFGSYSEGFWKLLKTLCYRRHPSATLPPFCLFHFRFVCFIFVLLLLLQQNSNCCLLTHFISLSFVTQTQKLKMVLHYGLSIFSIIQALLSDQGQTYVLMLLFTESTR